jgi:predicted dithiol-disulfide oxidoreductase (DUF899 family)
MIDQEAWEELRQIDEELSAKKRELAERRKELIRGPVEDYTLTGWDGPVTLSELFGGRDDLLIAHNMGKSCRYCTLWADEYNGVLDHIEDRTAFAVVSPDPPEVQREFAESRGWDFTMVSDQSEEFSRATTSAASGTSSTCSKTVPTAGHRSTVTTGKGARDRLRSMDVR